MKPRILVVEDEPSILDNILYSLATEGFEARGCATGGEARAALQQQEFALVVLDVGLPDMPGFELCREVRRTSNVPIIFLTARAAEVDRIVGLEIGGDDYVVKPFSPRELSARVKTVLRRVSLPPEAATLGHAFEEMRDALENRAYVENYVQTMTHEMKSPVAAIRGAAELLREEMPAERRAKFLANIDAEANRLQNTIDRLLALTALESRKSLEHPEPLALTDLAARVIAELQPVAEARGVRLELLRDNEPTVRGSPFCAKARSTTCCKTRSIFLPETPWCGPRF